MTKATKTRQLFVCNRPWAAVHVQANLLVSPKNHPPLRSNPRISRRTTTVRSTYLPTSLFARSCSKVCQHNHWHVLYKGPPFLGYQLLIAACPRVSQGAARGSALRGSCERRGCHYCRSSRTDAPASSPRPWPVALNWHAAYICFPPYKAAWRVYLLLSRIGPAGL